MKEHKFVDAYIPFAGFNDTVHSIAINDIISKHGDNSIDNYYAPPVHHAYSNAFIEKLNEITGFNFIFVKNTIIDGNTEITVSVDCNEFLKSTGHNISNHDPEYIKVIMKHYMSDNNITDEQIAELISNQSDDPKYKEKNCKKVPFFSIINKYHK